MGEKSSSLTFMQMKGMKEEREDGAEINIEKHNHFFSKIYVNQIHRYKKLIKYQTEEI